MKLLHYDLGILKRGEVIKVTLARRANVRLINNSNFPKYKDGLRYQFIGGLVKRSPVRLKIPHSDHWHIAIDMQGLRGNTRASVQVLQGVLLKIGEIPLSSVPSLVQHNTVPSLTPEKLKSGVFLSHALEDRLALEEIERDVFICHALEDRGEIVRSLAKALLNEGLDVWYNEFTLRIGDSLRRKINRGLAKSRVGLMVLSPSFIANGWANNEFNGIVTRKITGEQIVLPIWHNITKQEIVDFNPFLADKVARSTANHTVEEIAEEIAELLQGIRG